jgi:nucleoside 2-deoxyribosyltransferase
MQTKIYLAGPINGCTDDEACTWRDWFDTPHLSNVCAPFKSASFVNPMVRDYRGKELTNYREIVELDKRDIIGCDVVVVMYTKPSVGTSMEMLYAWENEIPVLLINESGTESLSPWLLYHSTAIVTSKEEAAKKLREWL